MAFFDELKQRKVVRVAVAYLVVAWLGVQVASIALPAFDAPSWVLRVVILLLALGFPMALILAWAIDLTPEGPRYSPGGVGWKRMVAISVGIGGLALAWYFVGQPAWRDKPQAAAVAPAPTPAATPVNMRSIAVLPFVNMSKDPANEYFSDGLAETTLDMLAQISDLKVIARTSSFAFKGKNSDVREIGRALDAAHLLEGSVQQAGNTVRITAQLIRVSDGTHLWSEQYDRQLTDVFKIQDEIAGEVVKALQLALPAAEQKRLTDKRTENVAAYKEYLRGNALLPRRRVAEMREALAYFERAIDLDPNYANAYAAASMTLGLLQNYAGSVTPAEQEKRRSYVDTALRLNPSLGEAYAARAGLFESERNTPAADEAYRRAIELAPNFATAYQWYAEFLQREIGDLDRALPLLRRAIELDPLSPIIRSEYVVSLAANNQMDEALAANAQLLRENPEFSTAYGTRAMLLEARGDLVGALRNQAARNKSDPGARGRLQSRCTTLLRFAALAEAQACADRIANEIGADEKAELQALLLNAQGKFEEAYGLVLAKPGPKDRWQMLTLQYLTGRNQEALATMKELMPELFESPPRLTSNYPGDAVLAGSVLVGYGATAQGRDLLQRALKANSTHPHTQFMYGRGWTDAYAWAVLGDTKRVCAALEEAVAAGFFLDLTMLDNVTVFAEARKQPCFESSLAPARAKAKAQLLAAREAKLI